MKLKNAIVVGLCAAIVTLSPVAGVAQQGSKGSKDPDKQSLLPAPKTKAESDAYNAIATNKDPVAQLAAADAFLASYGGSQMVGEIYGLRMEAYLALKKFSEAIDELDRALKYTDRLYDDKYREAIDKNGTPIRELANYRDTKKLTYFRRITDVAQTSSNKADRAVAEFFGKEVLKINPSDFPILLTVARVMAQQPPTEPEEKEKVLAEAEMFGQLAVNYIVTFLNSPYSAELKPEQRTEWGYRAHSLMGLIYQQKQNFADAEKAFKVAISYRKDGPVFYYLGFSYYSQKKYDLAIDAILKSIYLKGASEANAKTLLQVLYSNAKKNLADVDKDIEAAGQRLGKL